MAVNLRETSVDWEMVVGIDGLAVIELESLYGVEAHFADEAFKPSIMLIYWLLVVAFVYTVGDLG